MTTQWAILLLLLLLSLLLLLLLLLSLLLLLLLLVSVGRGVLQGDCLSPLLFNLCFNTFLQHIKPEKYRQLIGFSLKFLNPIHWFQFTVDATVISGQESDIQRLINCFIIWCNWSNMRIRVDKCSSFGIRKLCTRSVQYLHRLLIN